MLTALLSRSTCAECRQCCHFDGYDLWNTPVLDAETKERITVLQPETAFLSKGQCSYLFRLETPDADGTFSCPLLDARNGCRLGTEKPFECRIWPFCIMELGGKQVIAIAPICDAVSQLPLHTLLSFLKEGVAECIFSYAAAHPDIIRPYDPMYPILLWKPEEI